MQLTYSLGGRAGARGGPPASLSAQLGGRSLSECRHGRTDGPAVPGVGDARRALLGSSGGAPRVHRSAAGLSQKSTWPLSSRMTGP